MGIMKYGTTAKALEHTVDIAFLTLHRTVPHVIAANKVVMNKVVIPAGLFALSGVANVIAKIIEPKSFSRK
jgi:hypothetical protein